MTTLALIALLFAQDAGDLDKGKAKAEESGKAILLVTIWAPGVCSKCDDWRKKFLADKAVKEGLSKFVWVEWHYDGRKGKVMKWVNERGNTEADPCALVWALDVQENILGTAEEALDDPAEFARWLEDIHKNKAGKPKVPCIEVAAKKLEKSVIEDWRVKEIDDAKRRNAYIFLYFYIDGEDSPDKERARQAKLCKELEKQAFMSPDVGKLAAKFECFKLKMSDVDNRSYAKGFGVETAPAIVLLPPRDAPPIKLLKKPTAAELIKAMKEARGEKK